MSYPYDFGEDHFNQASFFVHNLYYKAVRTDDINTGDLVFDMLDGSIGVCDMRIEDKIAIRDGWAVEIAIPIKRCRKLIIIPPAEIEGWN